MLGGLGSLDQKAKVGSSITGHQTLSLEGCRYIGANEVINYK